ncbi:hypothetical protein CO112_04130 [Candidatus Dojkabacteria bacterium CG_4_9_14_3_um_filter_150_Dojkabacteria_WS6_41_13]|nr:MAG: hypothetical protein CO112_04130 [Candidatus Dojkabacteria bacterium CG_4_9_14_3_um_filter_150_Dojkabacteria_WS6_41_13]
MNLQKFISPALNSFVLVIGVATYSTFSHATPAPDLQFLAEEDIGAQTTTSTPEATTAAITATPAKAIVAKKQATITTTKAPVRPPAPKPKPKPKPVATCIITVHGLRYNVQSLKTTHSGGNIFRCGTDMTAVFSSQHGSNYALIAKYRI